MALINFRTLTIDDVVACVEAGGYNHASSGFEFARKDVAARFKYSGCSSKGARYLVAMRDDDDYSIIGVIEIVVSISRDTLAANFMGMPVFESQSEIEIEAFIRKRCI